MDDVKDWLLSFESGKKRYDRISSDNSRRVYLSRLKQYCQAVGKNPDELTALKVEGLKNIATEKEFQA